MARLELEFAINTCKATGMNRAFLPLHRGSDGFMSLKQFENLYWKQLKHVLETLVENGITPIVFYEGCWDQRLEYLAELPKGKTVGWFQSSDIFKVKEIVGDTMCIVGRHAQLASEGRSRRGGPRLHEETVRDGGQERRLHDVPRRG